MKKIFFLSLCLLIFSSITHSQQARRNPNWKPSIIPEPYSMQIGKGYLKLPYYLNIISPSNKEVRQIADQLAVDRQIIIDPAAGFVGEAGKGRQRPAAVEQA